MSVTLVVEPNPGGHRFQAVASVAALALRDGPVTLLSSAGARGSAEFAEFLADLDITVAEPFDGPVPTARALGSVIREHCLAGDVDRVVVMDGDIALKTWWLVAPKYFRGLTHRPRVIFFLTRYPARLAVSAADLPFWRVRLAKAVLLALAMATGTLHRAAGFAGRDNTARGWLVKRARDPASCRAHARERARLRAQLGLPVDRKIIGIFGGINVRKNPQLVLAAVERSGSDADLLLAGPMADDIRDWVAGLPAERRARVIVADDFLPDEVLDSYLASSDVVALVMKLEGPSGIQGKALAAGVPVVTAGSRTRERELRAMHNGAAVDVGVQSIAAGIRQVLDGQPETPLPASALPTPESFAATILGAEPSGGSRPGGARHFLLRVRNKLAPIGMTRFLRPVARRDLVRLGTDYGGWWVPESAVVPGAVAYCAGAGEDISFDLALHERGCSVTTFDPTPRAIAHVERTAPTGGRFRFVPVGWWDAEEELKFYSPPVEGYVSHSAVNLHGTSTYFVAKVKPVHQLMSELGDDAVDIVKLDIEGAEYRTMASMLAHGVLPRVLCVEFDQPTPLRRTIAMVRRLQRAGYTLNKIDEWNYTFTR